ncbi:MAG: SBBP repeat-containing protein [Bryobacteraceae bacterium]|nr:SBBP repeat-containing protein [Bryobacteraceae bacterium]
MHFEPNVGQVKGRTQWVARAVGATVYLAGPEVVFSVPPKEHKRGARMRHATLRLAGARPDAEGVGLEPLGSYSSYFAGRSARDWFTGIPHYGQVRYREIYPGIDLVYYGVDGNLEYDFELAPGADPSQIRLTFVNADRLSLTGEGDLLIAIGGVEFHQRRPRVLQAGREVAAGYRVSGREVRLELAEYDATKALVIDPVIEFSTFLGGPGGDSGAAVAVDSDGFIYFAGSTQSPASPSLDPFQQDNIVSLAPFVLKFNPTATRVVYFVVIGADGYDSSRDMVLNADGGVTVYGATASARFPIKNAFQTEYKGTVANAFLTRVAPDGRSLTFSTYYGGDYFEIPRGLATDTKGDYYVTGFTYSRGIPLKNPFQKDYLAQGDCFLAKVGLDGALAYSTYFGSGFIDYCSGVVVDGNGAAILYGESHGVVPLKDAMQTERSPRTGWPSVFLAKFSPDGGSLVFSTFLGGTASTSASGITLDSAGNILLTGFTYDTFFPVKNAFQATARNTLSGTIMKLDPSARNVILSTYFGGTASTSVSGVKVDARGFVYIHGAARSDDIPIKDSLQPFRGGGTDKADIFLAKFTPAVDALVYSTFLGGSSTDYALGVFVDAAGSVLVAGVTYSPDYPVRAAFQPKRSTPPDAVLTKIVDNTEVSPPTLSALPGRLNFVFSQGGNLPGAETVALGGPSLTFTVSASPSWIEVSASATRVPASLQVRVNPTGLNPGTNRGTITITPSSGTSTTIDVTLAVYSPTPVLQSLDPPFVALGSGDTAITLRGSGFLPGTALIFEDTRWAETPVTFVDASTLRVTLPSRMFQAAFSYRFGVQNPQSLISNRLSLAIGRPAPQIAAGGIVNAASYQGGGTISPGEIVTIFGSDFGTREKTQVRFSDIPATLIAISAGQISVTVPFNLSGSSAALIIESDGLRSTPTTLEVVRAKPGIFTLDASGKGQGAILNQDGTVNGSQNPASRGSIITLFGTGGGLLTADSLPRVALPVAVRIGGVEAEVLYAGVAPGLVPGVIQINVVVPTGVTPDPTVPIEVQIGEAMSASGVILTLKRP